MAQGFPQSRQTEVTIQGVGQFPGQDVTAEPIHDGHQIHEPAGQTDVSNGSTPDLIGLGNGQVTQPVGVNPVLRIVKCEVWDKQQPTPYSAEVVVPAYG